eukprot:1049356-Rhodomonas_salina.1
MLATLQSYAESLNNNKTDHVISAMGLLATLSICLRATRVRVLASRIGIRAVKTSTRNPKSSSWNVSSKTHSMNCSHQFKQCGKLRSAFDDEDAEEENANSPGTPPIRVCTQTCMQIRQALSLDSRPIRIPCTAKRRSIRVSPHRTQTRQTGYDAMSGTDQIPRESHYQGDTNR